MCWFRHSDVKQTESTPFLIIFLSRIRISAPLQKLFHHLKVTFARRGEDPLQRRAFIHDEDDAPAVVGVGVAPSRLW